MNLQNITTVLEGLPKFRLTQAMKAVYEELITDWNETSTLPKELRTKLNESCPLAINCEIVRGKNSEKALITLADETKIEAVLMNHKDERHTVCISTQVGCPMGCLFCATGKLGLTRNLSAEEMVEQVMLFARILKTRDERVNNVVFMGMGEPFLNYEEVMRAVTILHDKLGIGARRMSISTCGIVPGIKRLAKEKFDVNLAISLHAPTDALRIKLMPSSYSYPMKELFTALDYYVEQTNRQVMYEYIMLDGLNDSNKEARELVKLLQGRLAVVNLIPYNGKDFKPSKKTAIEQFKKILGAGHVRVIERASYGSEISGACGMLAGKSKNA